MHIRRPGIVNWLDILSCHKQSFHVAHSYFRSSHLGIPFERVMCFWEVKNHISGSKMVCVLHPIVFFVIIGIALNNSNSTEC